VRYWSVEEAQEYLPRLQELVERVRDAAEAVVGTSGNGHRGPPPSAQEAIEELEEGDIVLRDPAAGIIDFHARGDDGVVYYLCWRLGEPELAWWHLPEEGFAGRKPLPREST
jgi:hypothetical protein